MTLPLAPSTQISHYQIQSLIGSGTFSRVYRVRDTSDSNLLSRALLEPLLEGDAEEIDWRKKSFSRMAEILAKINPENIPTGEEGPDIPLPSIPQIYEFFEVDGQPFLVQELIDGVTYADVLSKSSNALTVKELEKAFFEALAGLAKLHRAKIVHRDIKPANLMRRHRDGSTVIIDFGAACDLSQVNVVGTQMHGAAITTLGQVAATTKLGGTSNEGEQNNPGYTRIYTPGYAHPDQRDGIAPASPQWDLYALAKTFVALRLGSNPPWAQPWTLESLGYCFQMRSLLRDMLKVEGCPFVDACDALAADPRHPLQPVSPRKPKLAPVSTYDSKVYKSSRRWLVGGGILLGAIALLTGVRQWVQLPATTLSTPNTTVNVVPGCPAYVSSTVELPVPNRGFAARFYYPEDSAHGDSVLQVWRNDTLIAEAHDTDIQGFIWIKSMAENASFPTGDYTLRLLIPHSLPYEQTVALSHEFPFHYIGRVTTLNVTCRSQSGRDSPNS